MLQIENSETAHSLIENFRERFGENHLLLACHAAFLPVITADLLYSLWINLQRDIYGQYLGIPWISVTDILLSKLCKNMNNSFNEVGKEVYKMDIEVRLILLNELKQKDNFGQQRLNQIAEFLFNYISINDISRRRFFKEQRWTALAYLQSNRAAYEIAEEFVTLVKYQSPTTEILNLALLVESLEDPLADFQELVIYARAIRKFYKGDLKGAISLVKKILTVNNKIYNGIILPLPESLKSNLNYIFNFSKRFTLLFSIIFTFLITFIALLSFYAIQRYKIIPENRFSSIESVAEFSDVQPTDWYFASLKSLIERYGVINGYPNGTFRGNRALTRYESVALLSNTLLKINERQKLVLLQSNVCRYEQPSVNTVALPQDMSQDDWAYNSYKTLTNVIGPLNYPNGTFRGNRALTRYEMASMFSQFLNTLSNSVKITSNNKESSSTPDINFPSKTTSKVTSVANLYDIQPTDWSFSAVQNTVEKWQILSGYPNGTFRGNRALTRAELVSATYSLLTRYDEFLNFKCTRNQ